MLIDRPDAMRMVHAMHENPAAHLAVGHDRVAGRPMKATTGIGPGRKGGQQAFLGRTPATDPARRGEVYRPTNQAIGRGFGLASQAVDDPAAVHPGLERALVSGGPSVVASRVSRDLAERGLDTTGRWDAPFPEHHPEQLAAQLGDRAEEQHR